MKKQKSKPKHKHKVRANKTINSQSNDHKGWVEKLEWIPDTLDESTADDADVSIISWNVLADSYCSFRSHKNLPQTFQNHVFDRNQRQHHVRQILRKFCSQEEPPILALQEVDTPLGIPAFLKQEFEYGSAETPTSKGGKNGRVDACGLYYPSSHYQKVQEKFVRLDDVASLSSSNNNNRTRTSSLQSVQTSFLRKNMALLVRLLHLKSNQEFVVAVLHLYWNPNYEYVKLCQIHHVLQQANEFCNNDDTPVIVCGDFNRYV